MDQITREEALGIKKAGRAKAIAMMEMAVHGKNNREFTISLMELRIVAVSIMGHMLMNDVISEPENEADLIAVYVNGFLEEFRQLMESDDAKIVYPGEGSASC